MKWKIMKCDDEEEQTQNAGGDAMELRWSELKYGEVLTPVKLCGGLIVLPTLSELLSVFDWMGRDDVLEISHVRSRNYDGANAHCLSLKDLKQCMLLITEKSDGATGFVQFVLPNEHDYRW